MFLRNDPPSATSRKLGRSITITYMASTLAFVVFFNLIVAAHLVFIDTSSLWVWLQVGGIALLAFATLGLVRIVRTTRPPEV